MFSEDRIWIGSGSNPCYLLPHMANRHGLITGATGTGKTISLKVLAESFSDMGVPVFLADVKGDLAGMCLPGSANESLEKRLAGFGISEFAYKSFPTCFWDLYGIKGHPIRTTVSDMGPLLLARLMDLTEVQSDVLDTVFRIADDKGLLLLDIKDLISLIQYVSANREEFLPIYGNMSPQSLGALLRNVLVLENNGGNIFFGEPALDILDWLKYDVSGRGYINILDSTELFLHPTMYATFMLWLLDELFETMPEVGDLDKPRLVFFFDEAHLLFNGMPKALLQKIEQVVKLIRSKGIGLYFITQSPADIPDGVLAQLSNKIQHALHAYTPKDIKAVRLAAESFRPNPAFNTAEEIANLKTGQALVSMLDEEGRPSVVEKAMILPPQSKMGTIPDEVRFDVMACSEMGARYDTVIDRYSAYEDLTHQQDLEKEAAIQEAERAEALRQEEARLKEAEKEAEIQRKTLEKQRVEYERKLAQEAAAAERRRQQELRRQAEEQRKAEERKRKEYERLWNRASSSFVSSIGRQLGNSIFRGILGGKKK